MEKQSKYWPWLNIHYSLLSGHTEDFARAGVSKEACGQQHQGSVDEYFLTQKLFPSKEDAVQFLLTEIGRIQDELVWLKHDLLVEKNRKPE